MKGKQALLLALALILPSLIFIFLKMFGENRFDVEPLFTDAVPAITRECGLDYKLPYHVPDSVLTQITDGKDSLVCVIFAAGRNTAVSRVIEKYEKEPVRWTYLNPEKNAFRKRCIFVVNEPFDLTMVDRNGRIRGQYNTTDRDEVDRLITEIAILLKKY